MGRIERRVGVVSRRRHDGLVGIPSANRVKAPRPPSSTILLSAWIGTKPGRVMADPSIGSPRRPAPSCQKVPSATLRLSVAAPRRDGGSPRLQSPGHSKVGGRMADVPVFVALRYLAHTTGGPLCLLKEEAFQDSSGRTEPWVPRRRGTF